jgi:hypothetical protein
MHVVALLNQSLVDNNPEIESKYHHHNVCLVFLTHFVLYNKRVGVFYHNIKHDA